MPIITQIICDSCQAVKKETNHWYTLVLDDQYQVCLRPMAHTPSSLLQLGASGVSYFCGMRCAIDGITQWMDRLTSPHGEVADESLCGAAEDAAASKPAADLVFIGRVCSKSTGA